MRLLPVLLALVVAPPAFAQQQTAPAAPPLQPTLDPQRQQQPPTIVFEPVAMMIAAFDADGDARVTPEEFRSGLKHSYDSVDPNRSDAIGYLAFSDWAVKWLGHSAALPSPFEADRDGDNRISFAELAGRFSQLVARFDADRDGVLTRAELVTVRSSGFGAPAGPPPGKPRRR